jgi:hypothetical protein
MKTRMQFCPVCQKQTPHSYKPISWIVAIILLLLWLIPGLLYIWFAVRRADRTAQCTVDHEALRAARENDRMLDLVRAMHVANSASQINRPVE